MSILVALHVLHLILVHGSGGQRIELNVHEISSITEPRTKDHFGKDVLCVIFMTNGKFIGVVETCKEITDKVKGIE